MARPKSSGLVQAIKLVADGKTMYAAHKITGVSQSLIAKAINPPDKPKCPTCGKTIIK